MLRIEKADSWSRQIGEEYTAPAQGTSIRTVLCDMLGPLLSPRKERNEAVLSWLLLNIGGSSIDIEYSTKISSRDIFEFTQTIKQFTKENKKGSRVFVEGLNLVVDCRKDLYFPKAFHLVPDLSRLELYITPPCTPNRALLSLFRIVINSCKSLKALEITGLTLNSVEISMLAKSLPSIEKLSFSCNILEDIDIDSLNECVHLESLEIYGKLQLSATVQALVRHHPSLKRLSIMCDNLDPGVAKSFEVCTCLESLEILGVCQPNATVQELVKHLPFLKALTIKCQPLDSTTAKNFHLCNKIEKLILCGDIQPSAAIEELLKNLSFIKDLKIGIDVVSHNIVIALRKCCTLYSLDLIVENYTPNTLAQYLKSPLPKLKYLEVYNQNNNNNYTKEDNLAVEKACAMGMSIYLGILPH
ncbi:hypothetical protein NECID01_2135 [Nematocida sp. AWRm77]|nr:hypothetical protein NECID01_2135 [Nematocida sp. AWRm77]